MANTRAHANIRRVAKLAGVVFPHPPSPAPETIAEEGQQPGDIESIAPSVRGVRYGVTSSPITSFNLPRVSVSSSFGVPRKSEGSASGTVWHTAPECDEVICGSDFCGLPELEPQLAAAIAAS